MTDVQQAVPVAQEDREFAAQWIVIATHNAKTIRAGDWDHHHGVQAAARHRLASLPCKSGEGAEASAGELVENAAKALFLAYAQRPEARWDCVDPRMQEDVWRAHIRSVQSGAVRVSPSLAFPESTLGEGAGEKEVIMRALDALDWANERLRHLGTLNDYSLGMCVTLSDSETRAKTLTPQSTFASPAPLSTPEMGFDVVRLGLLGPHHRHSHVAAVLRLGTARHAPDQACYSPSHARQ